jgi:HSP20 family protein
MNAPATMRKLGPKGHSPEEPAVRPAVPDASPMCPPIDIYEIDGYLIVEAALPGARSGDIDLSCSTRTLRMTGRIGEFGDTNVRWHQRQIGVGRFTEAIPLPVPVAPGRAVAALADGLLTVLLPKSGPPSTRPVRIRVDAAAGGS